MNRFFSFLAGVSLSIVAVCVDANAFQVSNSLEAEPDPTMDFTDLLADGYIFYKPEEVKSLLRDAQFVIQAEQKVPKDDGRIITTTIGNQLFLFAFFDCFEGGCFIMRPVHVIPTASNGLRLTPTLVNDLNVEFPLGNLMSTPDGDAIVRTTLVAAPECASACLDANLGAFLSAAGYAHRLLKEQRSKTIVDGSDFLNTPEKVLTSFSVDGSLGEAKHTELMQSPFASVTGDGLVDLSVFTTLKNMAGFEHWDVTWPSLVDSQKK